MKLARVVALFVVVVLFVAGCATPVSHGFLLASEPPGASRVGQPRPRLDDITVSAFRIEGGRASFSLMANGANIDADAVIQVSTRQYGNFTDQATVLHHMMTNSAMNAEKPETLGYPIFHYATSRTEITKVKPGTDLWVRVKNPDGQLTGRHKYSVPKSEAEVDSDGDGLLDIWETDGYTVAGVFVDLRGMGADPHRKDLFIEVDWMKDLAPPAGLWEAVESAFANAPVLNSDKTSGITIHIDRGQFPGGGGGDVIPFSESTRFDGEGGAGTSNFHDLKARHFSRARLKIFRYCIFVFENGHNPPSAGQAEDIWCNDFFVSLGSWGQYSSTRLDYHTGTFLHELGHTLGLRHGGDDNSRYKPNYNSVMPYNRIRTVSPSTQWSTKASPSMFGGIDVDGDMTNASGVFTYSQGQRAALNETALVESVGVCDSVGVDWNGDGDTNDTVSKDIDGTSAQSLRDFADWARIKLAFVHPKSKWQNN